MKKTFLLFLLCMTGIVLSAQTKVTITYKELPKEVTKYIEKNYNGYTVDKIIEGLKDGKPVYFDVDISKLKEKFRLTFDKEGNFVKADPLTDPPVATPPSISPVPTPKVTPPITEPTDTAKAK